MFDYKFQLYPKCLINICMKTDGSHRQLHFKAILEDNYKQASMQMC